METLQNINNGLVGAYHKSVIVGATTIFEHNNYISNALVVDDSFKYGLIGVAENYKGNSQRLQSARGESGFALEAELRAIVMAFDWALVLQWSEVTILSNYKVFVHALSHKKILDWRVAFYPIVKLCSKFSICNFKSIGRIDLPSQNWCFNSYECPWERDFLP
uniref:RNase H type-1 domain-containing protein n=1 Tax=Cannabis sativa TaxID=3483 RepID=A0A803PD96_CANSA